MEDLNKLLDYCHSNIGRYFFKNQIQTLFDDENNFAFDIEACPTDETKQEMFTYSLSFMSCDIENNVCYNFDDIRECINTLSGIKKELVIKQALNKIKEKYENSDDPTAYKFKAYNQVMSNLINYGKNDEVS